MRVHVKQARQEVVFFQVDDAIGRWNARITDSYSFDPAITDQYGGIRHDFVIYAIKQIAINQSVVVALRQDAR